MVKISERMMNKYKVCRLLLHRPRLYQELLQESGLKELRLITALGSLISNYKVKKEKVILSEDADIPELTVLGIGAGLLGLTEKKQKVTHRYTLTKSGEGLIGYYCYFYRCYEKWTPSWSTPESDDFVSAVTEIIKAKNYFGKPPLLFKTLLQRWRLLFPWRNPIFMIIVILF